MGQPAVGLQQDVAALGHLVGDAVESDGGQDEGAAAVQARREGPVGRERRKGVWVWVWGGCVTRIWGDREGGRILGRKRSRGEGGGMFQEGVGRKSWERVEKEKGCGMGKAEVRKAEKG